MEIKHPNKFIITGGNLALIEGGEPCYVISKF